MKNIHLRNTIILGVLAFVAITLPGLLIKSSVIDAYTAQIITLGGLNAIMAVSVNVICGITGQLSLGQAGFEAVGAYAVIALTNSLHIPLPLSILLAGLAAAFVGFLIGFPTLKLEGDYLAIVTLAFGEIIRVFLINLKDLTGGPNGKQFSTVLTTSLSWGATISWLAIVGTLTVVIILLQNFVRSTYGRAILSVREDEIAAKSNGISVFRYKMTGFVIASFIAGIAGGLYAPFIGFIQPKQFDFNASINDLIFVVFGGMGSVTGSVIAAFGLTILQESLRILKDYRLLIYPVLLTVMMLFRPQGLLGTKEMSFIHCWEKLPELRKKILSKLGKGAA